MPISRAKPRVTIQRVCGFDESANGDDVKNNEKGKSATKIKDNFAFNNFGVLLDAGMFIVEKENVRCEVAREGTSVGKRHAVVILALGGLDVVVRRGSDPVVFC